MCFLNIFFGVSEGVIVRFLFEGVGVRVSFREELGYFFSFVSVLFFFC